MLKRTFLLPLALLLFSCSQESPADIANEENAMVFDEAMLIDKETINLTSADAEKMAIRFGSLDNGFKSRSNLSTGSLEVSQILDQKTGKSLAFIINRGNDEGFMIVSATKTVSPVLAFSDTGKFDVDADPAAKSYLEGYKCMIMDANEPDVDSLRRIHAAEWAVFEKSEKQPKSRASYAEIEKIYKAADAGLPDFIKLRNEITAGRPAYIRGENSKGEGHAWVCEGYKNVKYDGVISMVIDPKWGEPDEPGSPYFDYAVNVYPPSCMDQNQYGEFYYMNLGWNGDNNGWYSSKYLLCS